MLKIMKKAIVAIVVGAILIAPTTAFAAETNQGTTQNVVIETARATPRSSSSFTILEWDN